MFNCPHCQHTIKLKTVKPGRFQLKCTRCAAPFVLSVSADAEPVLSVKALPPPAASPEATAPSVVPVPASSPDVTAPAMNPEATGAPAAANDADFSVSASLVANPDTTAALDTTQAPPAAPGKQRAAANFEVTQAEQLPDEEAHEEEAPRVEGMPNTLGGYQVVKELGRGGMGAVYLARQISLDRPVALKVMNQQWAKNPAFLVRFTREAYAAAQLVHHNVVQVYDVGCDKGIHYFSMEFVEGQSLGDLVKKQGKMDAATAAGYVLQAARGLKFAHDRGMIHRDVKPDNLMVNTQGIVKVADLGLVRTPGMADEQPPGDEAAPTPKTAKSGRTLASLSGVTMVGQAMGTPSYMAPEQARDSTKIDHRADVYSLGCTLYVLVTGKPVYQGSNALEVMTKHAHEPIVRPDVVTKEVPRGLSDVVVKMIAKKPDDRYASMDEVVKALEDFLGLQGAGKMAQTEQHLRTLEQSVKAFTSGTLTKLRSLILLGFFGGCAALFLLFLVMAVGASGTLGKFCWIVAGGVFELGLMTALSYFVVTGLSQKGPLFAKVRDFALSASWFDYAKVGVGLVLLVAVLWALGLLCASFAAALVAVGLALGLHYGLDRRVTKQKAEATEKVERMLKTLRLRGISEEAVQEFVAKYSGDHWEEFFEALFGYEAKLAARVQWGAGAKGARPKYAGWREPIIRWMDGYQRSRQEAKERKHLQRIEQASLEAQGVTAAQAQRQAEAVADAMVRVAADVRQAPAPVATATPPPGLEATVAPEQGATLPAPRRVPPPRRINVQAMFDVAAEPPAAAPPRKSRAVPKLFGALFGGGLRFLLGATLLAIGLFWLNARGLMPGAADVAEGWRWKHLWSQGQAVDPLAVPLVPEVVMQALCSLGALVAGALLVASAIWRSWKIGLALLLATAVMVVGPVTGFVPAVWIVSPAMLCLAAGVAIAGLGFMFGRDT